MLINVNRELHMLPQVATPGSIELVQHLKTPQEHHSHPAADRWRLVRVQMGQLTRGMTGCRRHSIDAACGASMLHKDFWLEALDEQHRYGFHLRAFHKAWKHEMAQQETSRGRSGSADASFFHWLDHGNGQHVELPECSQEELRTTRVEYCTPEQRKQYELQFVKQEDGVRAQYAASGRLVQTDERSKWIFVMDLSGRMYLGRKRKGRFHHSSFVSGAPISAAGKIIIKNGVILAIEPHSGHFKPRLENLQALCSALEAHGVVTADIAFIKPKKWASEWPFSSPPDSALEDYAGASDTEYGDKSDSEEPQPLLAQL